MKDHFPHALAITHEPADRPDRQAARAVTATSDPVEVAADFVAFATGATPGDDDRAVLTEAYEAAVLAMHDDRGR